ncbi:MotA/TolQ/ExbB proton channel family protein [Flavobacterium agricola]|uniref:MotA/TolQ/ExbB proton channel family protein n=1 Tax=Flavobacterium agricola TaxID=2870839 RepID=A0ABY6M4I8_9FLAO|nr:MotA/TolQ/ExbB proton channel family protein [Flavobacterium agricola]UYW02575.1 MotA/TolQ/ExbB proton channel family protein [Flavobacterium agricola]
MNFFLQITNDTLTQAAGAIAENVEPNHEISTLEFLLQGGVFLIPIGLLLFYTIYVIFERWFYISKATQNDPQLIQDVKSHLLDGNIQLAVASTQRDTTANSKVLKEGILTAGVGRPIGEIESNMEKMANIQIGEMEKGLGALGLIAGIAPTFGFVGTISGVIKIFYSISISEDISIGNISGGLYEKMISSAAGLIVGIIAYSAYHLFNGRIDKYALQTQKLVLEFINIIQRPNGNKTK